MPQPRCDCPGWHPCWEENVYAQGRQLNRYPYEMVVSFMARNFGRVEDRSTVRLLELGFGAGNNLWFAAREGFTVAGIEGSPTAVAFARERFKNDGLTGDLREGDFASLPWPDNHFHMVLDRGALTHARKPTIVSALDESRRVLAPGGRLLSMIFSSAHPDRRFGTPLGDNDYDRFSAGYFADLGTVHFVTRDEIDTLFGSRFTLTSVAHVVEEQIFAGPRPGKAYWQIECLKQG